MAKDTFSRPRCSRPPALRLLPPTTTTTFGSSHRLLSSRSKAQTLPPHFGAHNAEHRSKQHCTDYINAPHHYPVCSLRLFLEHIGPAKPDFQKSLHPNQAADQLNPSFIFPYSANKSAKRQQIWGNLQQGILFEDTQVFIPWLTPYSALGKYAEQKTESADRTNWFLGQHTILDGINSFVGVMKWASANNTSPFSQIDEFLGFDDEGNEKFIVLNEKFTDLFGEPTFVELEKFGANDLGSIQWTKGKIRVSLSGIERFACKYRLYVGLI